jgi:8-oxo-dGTP pyrophosphatase MutT (NUDIX family)
MRFKQYLETVYWGNVGAGILPIAKNTGRILLNHRSQHVFEPNTYGVFGGKIDQEEDLNPQAEARREFAEEAGYTGPIQLIPAYVYKVPTFTYYNFIGVIPSEFSPNIPPEHQWETQGWKWLYLDEVLQIEPKHFGLVALLKHSMSIIKKYAKDSSSSV